MASLGSNVKLELDENGEAAAILVTYSIHGSPTDGQGVWFTETVELIGVDAIPGEDGHDEAIPGVRVEGSLMSPFGIVRRSRLMAVPSRLLNEDGNLGPLDFRVDEIRARVTISRNSTVVATRSSNRVSRGGLSHVPIGLPA